jgi:quercetin dioxygenase-like cupin family protein
MKKYLILTALVFAALIAGNFLSNQSVQANKDKSPTYTATTDLKWIKTPFGPLASPGFGDFSKGQHITYIKFNAGDKTLVHTHSSDYVGVVLSGNMKHYIPGKPETEIPLPPGSHWSMPANVEHITECLPGVECVAVLFQQDKFDFLTK